eukprot:TRINITY_DN2933_c0_g1_i1.p1 TRINITY_DN2933_c0_g1~~TRINITY_DN2933_c0_g1_i1.p1  ORF type:complete len:285 (-),score=95.59 TRINITY_DN2933_c0_g1_i1:98-952(-)
MSAGSPSPPPPVMRMVTSTSTEPRLPPVILYQAIVTVKSGSDLIIRDVLTSDPYCSVIVGGLTRSTRVVEKNLNPEWNETFLFVTETPEQITFKVFDQDELFKNDPMGEVVYDAKTQLFDKPGARTPPGETFEGLLKLQKTAKGSIFVKINCKVMTPVQTEELLATCAAQLKDAQLELSGHKKVAKDLKEQLDSAKQSVEAVKQERDSLVAETESTKKSIAERESRLAFLEREIAQMEAQIAGKTKEVQQVQKTLYDKEHEMGIVIDSNKPPCCVMCGVNCSIM